MQGSHSSPAGTPVETAVQRYLALLAGDAPDSQLLELRYRVGPDRFASEFRPVYERSALAATILDRGRRTDVYVGCAPRASRRGTKEAIASVWTLWAECDGEECARALQAFRPRPALVIASGSGPNCHAYWPLSRAVTPLEAEAANLRLAQALGADQACFDASRILRPPGTWNFKHRPPTPVGVIRFHAGVRFEAAEVVAEVPGVEMDRLERRWARPTRDTRADPLLSIPPCVYVTDLLGSRPRRNGKVRCPFHHDERPSLHVYPTGERGWCCFSCRRGGTIYDLAAAIWGLETRGRDFVLLRERLLERYGREIAATHDREVSR